MGEPEETEERCVVPRCKAPTGPHWSGVEVREKTRAICNPHLGAWRASPERRRGWAQAGGEPPKDTTGATRPISPASLSRAFEDWLRTVEAEERNAGNGRPLALDVPATHEDT